MQGSNNQPPAMNPARGTFLIKDLARNKDFMGMPSMKEMHSNFFDVAGRIIHVQRVILATIILFPDLATAVISSFSNALYFDSRSADNTIHITDDWIKPVVARAIGDDDKTTAVVQKAKSDELKALLKQNTAEALALGAFGVPMMMISTPNKSAEFFFGSDRFEQIAHFFQKPWYGPCGPPEKSRL
eukprot:GEMP01064807.1.p1 GENE.GEMP01064807.1~~GEMP01064807.1.p1  ORF type:complete len:186 (+),score=36.70 GEMP01064807.1:384-941(+)